MISIFSNHNCAEIQLRIYPVICFIPFSQSIVLPCYAANSSNSVKTRFVWLLTLYRCVGNINMATTKEWWWLAKLNYWLMSHEVSQYSPSFNHNFLWSYHHYQIKLKVECDGRSTRRRKKEQQIEDRTISKSISASDEQWRASASASASAWRALDIVYQNRYLHTKRD